MSRGYVDTWKAWRQLFSPAVLLCFAGEMVVNLVEYPECHMFAVDLGQMGHEGCNTLDLVPKDASSYRLQHHVITNVAAYRSWAARFQISEHWSRFCYITDNTPNNKKYFCKHLPQAERGPW
jgi:hypothetical protein